MVENLELELDSALSRLVDEQDKNDRLQRDNDELSDALGAMTRAHDNDQAELGSLRRRCAELEAQQQSRAAG